MTPDEQNELKHLLADLDRAKLLQDFADDSTGSWRVAARSPLAGDDAKTSPYQVSHAARDAMNVATDHLMAIRSSLLAGTADAEGHLPVTVHRNAVFSLIRGAFENAARAVWILEPSRRRVRIERRVQLYAKEIKHSYKLRELIDSPAQVSEQSRMNELADVLAVAGTPIDQARRVLRQPLNYGQIVREAGAATMLGADRAELIWSSCSGLSHGDGTANLSWLDREIVSTTNGVAHVRLTTNISMLRTFVTAALLMMDTGIRLYRTRGTCHL